MPSSRLPIAAVRMPDALLATLDELQAALAGMERLPIERHEARGGAVTGGVLDRPPVRQAIQVGLAVGAAPSAPAR